MAKNTTEIKQGNVIELATRASVKLIKKTTAELLAMNSDEVLARVEKEKEQQESFIETVDDEQDIESLNHTDEQGNPLKETHSSIERGNYWDRDNAPAFPSRAAGDNEWRQPEAVAGESLADFVLRQLLESTPLSDKQRMIAEYVIGNIDNNGWIGSNNAAIASDIITNESELVTPDEVEDVVKMVQQLDPAGIGARNIKECLMLQAVRVRGESHTAAIVFRIIDECFDELTTNRYSLIHTKLKISSEEFTQALHFIRRHFSGKPGSSFGDPGGGLYVRPEFEVTIDDDDEQLHIDMPNKLPQLQISKSVDEAIKSLKDKKDTNSKASYYDLLDKRYKAETFISALKERQLRLMAIMSAIVKAQEEYFRYEDLADLKPLRLEDIATASGFDKSTISRACNSKWVAMPSGSVKPMKFFFNSSGMKTDADGENEGTKRATLQLVKDIIFNENKHKPLSDEKISEMLKERGHDISRRTVDKYRAELGIPASSKRRIR